MSGVRDLGVRPGVVSGNTAAGTGLAAGSDLAAGSGLAAERRAWLALAAVPGVGEQTFARLIGAFGCAARTLVAAGDGSLRRLAVGPDGLRLRSVVVDGIEAAAADPEAVSRMLAAQRMWALTPLDAGYPGRLDVLVAPPPVLYGLGQPSALTWARAVAIVGTRRPTPVGRVLAGRFARRSVELGASVVSGLAFGIDGAAHAATVEHGGTTVAVIAAGHGQPGPRAHRALLTAIVETGGAVISEHPPPSRPEKGSFPRRNRLIAALGDVTMVVEAPARSGALNTAHHALEQGRPLLVAPGRPGDASVAGCLRLLRETPARPIVGDAELVDDLLRHFAEASAGAPSDVASEPSLAAMPGDGRTGDPAAPNQAIRPEQRPPAVERLLAELGPVERQVALTVARQPGSLDELVAVTGLAPGALAGAVSLLHLRGLVRLHGASVLPTAGLADRAR